MTRTVRGKRTQRSSEHRDFVIVGAGIAAVTAAYALRDEGCQGSILILSAEDCYPYNRPPLTKGVLSGRFAPEDALIVPPEEYRNRGIEVRLNSGVRSVAPQRREIQTESGERIGYGKLLIATGAVPRSLAVPGSGLAGIFHLHSIHDPLAVREYLSNRARVVIVGTSFIALEAATTLTRMHHKVTLIDEAPTIFPRIASPDLAHFFMRRSAAWNIDVQLNESIQAFRGSERVNGVTTTRGEAIDCDAVILAIGVAPSTALLSGSDIKVDDGILVDEFLQTSHSDIYAAGDVARYADRHGRLHRTDHWENARRQGRVAAKNMLGRRIPYDHVTHYFCNFLDFSFTFLGESKPADTRIQRGHIEDKDFAEFYLRDGRTVGLFSTGRPPEETQAIETLIREKTKVDGYAAHLADPEADIAALARTTVFILQGGGALGAFECGVIRAMEEAGIHPGVVGGVSIGAVNGAIIAANPRNATSALESFWDEISLCTPSSANQWLDHGVAAWDTLMFGIPKFFRPRWLYPAREDQKALPINWTSLYDPAPLKALLEKYVDFTSLRDGPVRLILGAVDVENGSMTFFDSRVDDITADHVLASCSLPPYFPWTTIGGRHYWDAGVISNSPLEHVLMKCGANHKDIYMIDLFPGRRSLPSNLGEVITRKDEITYGERIRRDTQLRELVDDFQALVSDIMRSVDAETAARLRQRPRYIDLMGLDWTSTITRIVRDSETDEWPALDYDFSASTIARHQERGYEIARQRLREKAAPRAGR